VTVRTVNDLKHLLDRVSGDAEPVIAGPNGMYQIDDARPWKGRLLIEISRIDDPTEPSAQQEMVLPKKTKPSPR